MSDEQLNQLAEKYLSDQDPTVFAEIYERIVPELRTVAARFNLVGHDKDDLIQISVLNIWRKFDHYRPSTPFIAFVRSMGFRRMADIWKAIKKRGEKMIPQSDADEDRLLLREAKTEHPVWGLIYEEEIAIQRRRDAAQPLSDIKARQNQRYMDCYWLRRSIFEEKPRFKPKPRVKPVKANPYQRKVKRLDTGKVFADVYEAVRTINGADYRKPASKLSILNAAKFGYKCAGTKWSFADAT